MRLYLQGSSFVNSYTLHEALLHSCGDSIRGGGVYAFVTSGGVKLLLEDDVFLNFFERSDFQLIIGTDAITNENALQRLGQLGDEYPKLDIKAFFHNVNNTTFHLKYCWFKKETGGVVVLGSGNLTEMGLRKNWEAFTVSEVSEDKIHEIESQWNDWVNHNEGHLKPISDPDVIQKAKNNKQILRKIKHDILPTIDSIETLPETNSLSGDNVDDEDLEAWQYVETDKVLIAEIPRSGNRWKQANFDQNNFIDFFGATPGDNTLRILLKNVKHDGSLSNLEIRPSISVKSMNYRFELDAAASLNYPENGRPIGVFVRISNRMFLYVLSMPDNSEYDELLTYLNNLDTSGDEIRRCRTNISELKTNCPNLPLWIGRGT